MENPATTTPEAPTPTPEEIEEQHQAIKAKFDGHENDFKGVEKNIGVLREFMVKHRDAMAPFIWTTNIHQPSIYFNCAYSNKGKQKEIARAFGAEGWTRHKNEYTCGRIDWKKTIDGVRIEIDCAEQVEMKLKEEVRL